MMHTADSCTRKVLSSIRAAAQRPALKNPDQRQPADIGPLPADTVLAVIATLRDNQCPPSKSFSLYLRGMNAIAASLMSSHAALYLTAEPPWPYSRALSSRRPAQTEESYTYAHFMRC